MAISDRYTGQDLVVHFLPTGGTVGTDEIALTGSYTSFSYNRQGDTADVSAGSETTRSYIPTLEDLTFDVSYFDESANSDYADTLPLATGLVTVYPKGTAVGSPMLSFNAIIESFNHTFQFDDGIEIEISGKRTGDMIAEIGTVVPSPD